MGKIGGDKTNKGSGRENAAGRKGRKLEWEREEELQVAVLNAARRCSSGSFLPGLSRGGYTRNTSCSPPRSLSLRSTGCSDTTTAISRRSISRISRPPAQGTAWRRD